MSVVLQVENLVKLFPVRGSRGAALSRLFERGPPLEPQPGMLHAVDSVSFHIDRGEAVGLVGESGCGKSTLARLIVRLIDPTSGSIRFAGEDIGAIPARRFSGSSQRARLQMVFQDAMDSLNPRFTAFDTIADPIRRLLPPRSRSELSRRVASLAEMVGLEPELLRRFPHQLSGGQRARVGIARAIAIEPDFVVLDEPTSALDVSVQVLNLKLLQELRQRLSMTYLFVSHDLNVVRLLCDRVLVMYLGKIVESGRTTQVFTRPAHPYTRALLSAVPSIEPGERNRRVRLSGEPSSPIDPNPCACRFAERCASSRPKCLEEMPRLNSVAPNQEAACHFPWGDGETGRSMN